ncbi:MAG: thioredoxin [Clostridia bacterium]|nr:thioredoxin [Clostridia bacterium]
MRYGVLAVGLALLVYGFATGGIADVLTKAVNICTECIGLG